MAVNDCSTSLSCADVRSIVTASSPLTRPACSKKPTPFLYSETRVTGRCVARTSFAELPAEELLGLREPAGGEEVWPKVAVEKRQAERTTAEKNTRRAPECCSHIDRI